MIKKVLSIAGSDCSGGAGIAADIKTITVHKLYAMSVITALTAQNTTGVYGIMQVTADFVAKQMDCVFSDIPPDAVKIGMVSSGDIIETIADKLLEFKAEKIVLDPVMVSTSGSRLMDDKAVGGLIAKLFPLAALVTPNIPEAEVLCGFAITNQRDMQQAADAIAKLTKGGVLIKGGHLCGNSDDLLYIDGRSIWYPCLRVDNPNTHGTGCTLSSAIACNLANGLSLTKSVELAKAYVTGALQAGLNLGKGSGPLNHGYNLKTNIAATTEVLL